MENVTSPEQQAKEDAAKNWAVENKSIYAPVDSEDAKRIADLDAARRLAQTENDFGREAALKMEGRLQREAGTGMTDEQRKFREIMDGVEQKYPDAFETVVDKKGRKLLITHGDKTAWPGKSLVFSREGVLSIDNTLLGGKDKIIEAIDWEKFNDLIEENNENIGKDEQYQQRRDIEVHYGQVAPDAIKDKLGEIGFGLEPYMYTDVKVEMHNLLISPSVRESIKNGLVVGQKEGEEKKKRLEMLGNQKTSEEIVNLL